jgi:Tol biopolymer transport system component
MTRMPLILLVTLLGIGLSQMSAHSAGQAERLYASAQHKETTEGDLKGAIEIYHQVVTGAGSNRALASRALLRMAECHRRLGDAEARRIYERIVRDYADQAEAVQARERLGALPARPALQTSRVDIPKTWNYAAGYVSADGRYLPYIDDEYGLAVRDLSLGTDRVIIRAAGTGRGPFPGAGAISRDGSQLAFSWCYAEGSAMTRVCELRVTSLSGSRGEPRKLAGDAQNFFVPLDWSPDGSEIAVRLNQADITRIGFVNVRTGAVRALKSVDWRGRPRAFISPDGLDIAFDLQEGDTTTSRDVFVLAVDGTREVHAVEHPSDDRVVGWSPDGRQLLFTSNRRGQAGLWAQPWAGRKPNGESLLVSSDLKGESLGVTKSGAVFTQAWTPAWDVELTSIDLTSPEQAVPSRRLVPMGSSMNPAWSPDGRSLAYTRTKDDRQLIGIRDMASGQVRELEVTTIVSMQGLSWSPDGRSFFVNGADLRGRYGIYSIDAHSGAVTPVVVPIDRSDQLSYEGFFWSPDSRRLYYHSQNGKIHERDSGSGVVREVARGAFGPISLSPDGRWIATSRRGIADGPESLVLLAPAGGEVHELLRLKKGEWINNVAIPWTPDSRAVLMRKMLTPDGAKSELWIVPIAGAPPRQLEFDASRIAGWAPGKMRLHPDGRQFAFVSGSTTPEVWKLENFLPSPGAADR